MQRLENLEITKVAFVPEGDNKKADVLLFKSKPAEPPGNPDVQKEADKEANVIKRVLLAIGKALGFDEDESATTPTDPPAAPAQNDPTTNPGTDPVTKTTKGVDEDMKIDKSKLTPEELAALEAIEKKAGIQDDEPAATDPVAKSTEPAATEPAAEPAATDPAPAAEPAGNEDIYKGLHPAVAAELKALRKRADEAEDRELAEVTKKYEIIGKKPEELVPLFKSLKAAGGAAYDQMIAVLDASVQTVEKSGAFSEIGKSTSGGQSDAWAQIEKHAEAIQKSAPTMTWNQAVDKACEQHPELVAEYETNR